MLAPHHVAIILNTCIIQAKIQTYLEQIFQELEAQLCPEEETWH
jgi:hypothetical protein